MSVQETLSAAGIYPDPSPPKFKTHATQSNATKKSGSCFCYPPIRLESLPKQKQNRQCHAMPVTPCEKVKNNMITGVFWMIVCAVVVIIVKNKKGPRYEKKIKTSDLM